MGLLAVFRLKGRQLPDLLRGFGDPFNEFNESVSVRSGVLNGESVRRDTGVSQLAPLVLHLLAEVIILEEVDYCNRVNDLSAFWVRQAVGVHLFRWRPIRLIHVQLEEVTQRSDQAVLWGVHAGIYL